MGIGALTNHRHFEPKPGNITVDKFLINEKWDANMVRKHAPLALISKILAKPIKHQANMPDQPIWKLNSTCFTCASAWDVVRKKKNHAISNTHIWSRYIPFKVSFLVGILLRNKLLGNDKIITFGQ